MKVLGVHVFDKSEPQCKLGLEQIPTSLFAD